MCPFIADSKRKFNIKDFYMYLSLIFPSSSVFSHWIYVNTVRINFKPTHKHLHALISWLIIVTWETRLCQRVFSTRWNFLKSCQEKSYGGPWMLQWQYSSGHEGWSAEWPWRGPCSTISQTRVYAPLQWLQGYLFFRATPIWDSIHWIGFPIPTQRIHTNRQHGTWHVGLISSRPRSFSDDFGLKSI